MATEPPDQLRYLCDTVEAYRRRFDREPDEEVRRYLWQRILDMEAQLARQSSSTKQRRKRASGPSEPGVGGADAPPGT